MAQYYAVVLQLESSILVPSHCDRNQWLSINTLHFSIIVPESINATRMC